MRRILCCLLLFLAATALAQEKKPNPHEHDFDYLLGDWEFKAEHFKWGKFGGFWSAMKLENGQVFDQYRVADNGKTIVSTFSLRAYNAARDEWELVSTNGQNGVRDFGTAHRDGNEMKIEQTFGSSQWHIRYHDIEPNHFLWDGDCSLDGGKTWKRCLHIEATRIGPPRSLGNIAPVKR